MSLTEKWHKKLLAAYHDLHGRPPRRPPVHRHALVDHVGHGPNNLCGDIRRPTLNQSVGSTLNKLLIDPTVHNAGNHLSWNAPHTGTLSTFSSVLWTNHNTSVPDGSTLNTFRIDSTKQPSPRGYVPETLRRHTTKTLLWGESISLHVSLFSWSSCYQDSGMFNVEIKGIVHSVEATHSI